MAMMEMEVMRKQVSHFINIAEQKYIIVMCSASLPRNYLIIRLILFDFFINLCKPS